MMPAEDPYDGNRSGPVTRTGSPARTAISRPAIESSHVRDFNPDKEAGQDNHHGTTTETAVKLSAVDSRIAGARNSAHALLHRPVHHVTLKFEDVVYKIKLNTQIASCSKANKERRPVEKTILNGLTGMVRPGETLAMLGPSGSGKTTLLSALGGRLEGKVSGSILYNGQRFAKSMKRRTGFVTQDDVLYPHLTVRETLVYAALLRLPRAMTKQNKKEHVDAIITELGLSRCKNTIIGGPLLRGVSGGERKRVSIGHEMLTNPSLLLLDEPTSGLDSTTAQRIIVTLHSLAKGGRTVITTIHQPSSSVYYMFNKVILLSEGNAIYYGEASAAMDYFNSIGLSPLFPTNPADFMLDLANGIAPATRRGVASIELLPEPQAKTEMEDQKNVRQNLAAQYKRNLASKIKAELNTVDNCNNGEKQRRSKSEKNEWETSWWEQFCVLLKRSLKERQHESFSGLRIFQVLAVSILSGLLWWQSKASEIQDQVGLLFFFSIFWGFFPLFNAIFTFPQEKSMLIKERSSAMYRLSSYFCARTVGDLPMELILPTVYVTITYWMGGLKHEFSTFIFTLLIILYNVLVSQGLGLAMGAALMDVKQATTLSSVTMLTFLLAGGYYIHNIPPFIAWIKYLSFSYYCYKLLVGVQYSKGETYECYNGRSCSVADYPAIKAVGLDSHTVDLVALAIMLVGYRLLAYAALRRVKPISSRSST